MLDFVHPGDLEYIVSRERERKNRRDAVPGGRDKWIGMNRPTLPEPRERRTMPGRQHDQSHAAFHQSRRPRLTCQAVRGESVTISPMEMKRGGAFSDNV